MLLVGENGRRVASLRPGPVVVLEEAVSVALLTEWGITEEGGG